MAEPFPDDGTLGRSPEDVRLKASAGVVVLGTRGVAILLLGFAGSVVFARLLDPRDFGVLAIGLTLTTFLSLLSDGGLGSGLIRRKQPPSGEELRAVTALQLAFTLVVAVVVTLVAIGFGETGAVVAVMVWSVPLMAFQSAGRILLERGLSFRPLALVEVTQVFVYQATGIVLVVIGWGVWGLAFATVIRAAAGSALMFKVCPGGRGSPRFSWSLIRPLLPFGLRLQAVSATWLMRDQGMNLAIAAIAGLHTLGYVSLVRRLLDVPYLLLTSLWRVSGPAMSQLLSAKEDPAPLIERAVAVAAVGTGVILVGMVGSAPGLVPAVFGEQWRPAIEVLPGACLGLGIAGSVSVATQGYLYALGDATSILRATAVQTVVVFIATLPLLSVWGLWAVGFGALISGLSEAVVLIGATRRTTQVHLVPPLVPIVSCACIGAGAGWWVTTERGSDAVAGVLGAVVSVAVFGIGLLILRRSILFDSMRFVQSAVRAMIAGHAR